MVAGSQSSLERRSTSETHSVPEISICKRCPETSVFLEAGNTDGWIASDLTVDVVL